MKDNEKWWEKGRLNVQGAFDDPEWVSFDVENVDDDDKRLLNYFSWARHICSIFNSFIRNGVGN